MKKSKILIIEDDVPFLEALSHRLKEAGYEVIKETDGKRGLLALKKSNPSLIILDLMLPNLSGVEILQEMQQKGGEAPVIVSTARFLDSDLLNELRVFNPFEILQKPYSMKELLLLVSKALTKAV